MLDKIKEKFREWRDLQLKPLWRMWKRLFDVGGMRWLEEWRGTKVILDKNVAKPEVLANLP
jgi:hypothetical protein